jgi:exodeoxyribonuclease V alpha subunit
MEELTCKIQSVVFLNKQTGFFVLKTVLDGTSKPVTVRGSSLGTNVDVGLKIRVKGQYENNPTYGKQFNAITCDVVPEFGKIGVISYLTSHVKSIGPVTASKLYDAFGDSLLDVLENSPDKIRELSFLTKSQMTAILEEWQSASAMRTSSIFLTDLGLNASQVKSAFGTFGSEVRKVVETNPYDLCICAKIGFATADSVARRLGIGADDTRRVRAMILFFISDLSQSEGHVNVTSEQLLEHSKRAFKRYNLEPFSHGSYLLETSFYSQIMELKANKDIVCDGPNIYLPHHWLHESESAKQISSIIERGGVDFDLDKMISEFEAEKKLELSDDQKLAVSLLKSSRMCVISGYPGTGKTTLVSAFVHVFERMNLDYALMSPTGIAAKRLSQVTNKPAYTIHRALGCDREGQWEFNAANKYSVDAVIVDEVSMVDASTFYHLITALPPTTIVVLIGDSAQLPSVGAGYVLHELMKCVPHVSLTRIYRQEGCSDIIEVAHAILRGNQVDTSFNKESEFVFFPMPIGDVLPEVSKLTSMMKEKKSNFQVIAPVYDGDLGVNNLNRNLRETLNTDFVNGKASKIKHGDTDMFEGDRVMVIRNDYDRMIFNGDVGKVQRILIKQDEVEVRVFNWFDSTARIPRYVDKIFTFKIEEARLMLKVAYACTVHKCVSPDTLVETENGLCRISDIPESGTVATPTGRARFHNKIVNPAGEMIRVTTVDGYMLEMTPDHGVDAWDEDDGYVRKNASQLQEGDIIPLRLGCEWPYQPLRSLPNTQSGHFNEVVYQTPSVLVEEVAEFLGLMVADGTVFAKGFRLVKQSEEVINRFQELCVNLFNTSGKRIIHNGTSGIEISSTYLARWLKAIDGLEPRNKSVPMVVLRSSLSIQAAFLRGLFEDGAVNIDSVRGCVDHVELVAKERIARDVRVMLLRFGIVSGVGIRHRLLSDGLMRDYHTIYVYGENVKTFSEQIGFITRNKQQRTKLPHGINRHYFIPVLKSEALRVQNANGGPKFFSLSDKNVFTRGRMSRRQLAGLLDRAKSNCRDTETLRARLQWHHSTIAKMERFVGPSMCVEVPDGHKFVQNGFCAWNCQGQEFDYVVLPMTMKYGIMLYRNLVYTAITRAKKKVFVFGDPTAFSFAIRNDRETVRNSNLSGLVQV